MIPFLPNMAIYLKGISEKENVSFAKDYAETMMKEMRRRFPGSKYLDGPDILGVVVDLYVLGLFVYPFYRGNLLKKILIQEFNSK